LKDLTWGLVLDPGNVHLQILHAKLTGKGYEPEEAGENENPWQSQFSIALSLFTQGAYDDALREIHKLEEAQGPNLQTRFWKAQIHLSKGDFQKGRVLRDSIAAEALAEGKVMLWAWARDLDWRCRLDDLWNGSS
jgi:predicted metal-dependent hydrolase